MIPRHFVASLALPLLGLACGGGTGSTPSEVPDAGSSVSGIVFYDQNGDGRIQSEERVRLPGVRAAMAGRTGTSDAAGRFTLSGVPRGVQTVAVEVESLPSYFQPGPVPAVTLPLAGEAVVEVPVTLAIRNNHPNRYLAFGDSITDGAGSLRRAGFTVPLERRLQAFWGEAEVISHGVYGSTSLDGLTRLPGALGQHRPAYTLVLYGANDWTRCQYIAPEACYTVPALRDMIRLIRDTGSLPVVGTILPVNPEYTQLSARERNEWVQLENALVRPMVQQEGAVLVDTWAAFGTDQNVLPQLFFDHVHPSEDGYSRIAEAFFQAITGRRTASR